MLISLLLIMLVPIVKDTAPFENDYSWDDFKSSLVNAEESFEILRKFSLNEKPDIDIELPDGLKADNYSNIEAYQNEIIDTWHKVQNWREYIDQLNSFDGIADLTEPVAEELLCFSNIRKIAEIYCAYAVLQTRLQHPEEGIRVLNEIHSIVRKALPYSRYLIHNLIWTAVAKNNIRTACVIASSSQCQDKDLKLLKDGFPPLFKYDRPFSNMFISEYLFIVGSYNQENDCNGFLGIVFSDIDREKVEHSIVLKTLSKTLNLLAYKENKTHSNLKLYFDHLINNSTTYSEFAVAEKYLATYCKRPDLANSAGWMTLSRGNFDFQGYYRRMIELTVESDLLFLYFQERLGEQDELVDCFSGEKYLRNKKTNLFYSVGPDGKAETKDDICLYKWYAVNQ